jgi:flagellar L-ring protein precursor FlgH
VGCSSLPQTVSVDFPETTQTKPVVAAPVAQAPASGSLFLKASYRPAFEDQRARMVGDVMTIHIIERVKASQVSNSTAKRNTSGSTTVGALPFLGGQDLVRLNTSTSSKNEFAGDGATANDNSFEGYITVTVVEALPNGHLKVAGDKQIGLNQNVDVMRFSGTIDPRLIQPGNLINSTQVANARMESKGRGAQAEAQTVGWLTRFFFSFLPF